MTQKSTNELLAQAAATLPDNTTQDISAADVRQMFVDFIDTVAPAYGAIQLVSQAIVTSATPAVLAPFTTQVIAQPGYSTNLTNGTVTRELLGVAGGTDQIYCSGSVEGNNNSVVTVTLYRNGAPLAFKSTATCRGAGNLVSFSLTGITYTDVDGVYDVRVTGDTGTHTFHDVNFIVQRQPVRSFV
jgi:hypothetical protein